MIRAAIEQLLRATIGLDAASVGSAVIAHALKQRMAATGLADPAAYLERVRGSRQELQELIDAVVVPETWFFRDREAFAAMVGHARAVRRPGQPLRLLSLPSSTGEEPYSMAMAMFDAGFAAADFAIEAIDVSSRAIAAAETAVYGRNSFRGSDIAFRDRHFEPAPGGYRPLQAIRRQVRFTVGNLFEVSATGDRDIIFCRNLLIYFDRAEQERALARLWQMLAPDGMLLVGPAESSLPSLCGFVSARLPMAFAFRPRQDAPEPVPLPRPARPKPAPAARKAAPPPPPRATLRVMPPPAAATADDATASLAAVERACDAGRLDEARAAARVHIDRFGPSAAIYYLLGLAQDAGDAPAAAIESYRKALYLEPDHRETLAHLALLLQRQGDAAAARVLLNRLARIDKRSGAA